MGSAANRNSDGWQKCFTNVPPGASRGSADHNVKMFLAASAMPWMGSLPALLTVANVVSVANSNFQLATLVLIIGNILTLATFSKTRLKIRRGPLAVQLPCECRAFILRVEVV